MCVHCNFYLAELSVTSVIEIFVSLDLVNSPFLCVDVFMLRRDMATEGGRHLANGHTKTVLTVAATNSPDVQLISGAETGELAVWSVDGACLHQWQIAGADGDATSVACSNICHDLFYVACGVKIYCYDLRNLSSYFNSYNFNEDEINEISLNEKETFLAAADDSDNIKVINLTDSTVFKTLRKHTNICSAVRFRPHWPRELLSGGYDSKLIQWDVSKSRAYCIMDMREMGCIPDELDCYLVNPPFVHSIAVSTTGNTVAVGTENALVHLFDASKKTLQLQHTLCAHTRGVSQVYCPMFAPDKFVVSGGNDGRICVWDVECSSPDTVAGNGCTSSVGQSASSSDVASSLVYEIMHTEKVNWITCATNTNRNYIVVGDNTPNPVLYPFPE